MGCNFYTVRNCELKEQTESTSQPTQTNSNKDKLQSHDQRSEYCDLLKRKGQKEGKLNVVREERKSVTTE
jgi:hypothetical protein